MKADITIQFEGQAANNVTLASLYTIGRATGNDLIIQDVRVSRNHALIRQLGGGKYYLVDLGSSNGTFLNGRPVMAPAELKSGDKIQIADCTLEFSCTGQSEQNMPTAETTMATQINASIETISILVVDIRNYTRLTEQIPPQEFARFISGWFRDAAAVIERESGSIDKFIGDAIMAFWVRGRGAGEMRSVHGPLNVCRELLSLARSYNEKLVTDHPTLGFAIGCAVHSGDAILGNTGQSARRDFTATGDCVNIAFRLESLCKELRRPILVSEEIRNAAASHFAFDDMGLQTVKGKSAPLRVFALAG